MCNMSNVGVSSGSPPLERVPDRPTDQTKPTIRRNLFGSPERSREEVSVRMQGAERRFMERWNYDVSNDRPLSPGNCQWEAVRSSEVPHFYSRPPHKRGGGGGGELGPSGRDSLSKPGGELDLNGNRAGATGSQPDTGSSSRQTGTSCSNTGSKRRPASPSPDSPSPKRSHDSEEDEAPETEEAEREDDSSSHGDEDEDEDGDEDEGDVSADPETTPRRPDSRT